ncbi:hamartin [Homalodisca vitripennis]|nr:hamartin [Homalodisca vitripennis]
MSALLVINVLLPTVAGLMESCLQELFTVFSHLAKFDTINPNKLSECQLFHLQMGLYALFLRLYGMYPCNFLSYLRIEYSQSTKLLIFNHTIRCILFYSVIAAISLTGHQTINIPLSKARQRTAAASGVTEKQGRPIIYLDESYILSSHVSNQTWSTSNKGLHVLISKCERLVIIHAGGEKEYVPNAFTCWKASYHDNVNGNVFMKWMKEKVWLNL